MVIMADGTTGPAEMAASSPLPLQPPPPPPEREFDSRDALLAFVRGFTVAHGYAVVISKSNVPRGQVWLRCDLGGRQRGLAAPAEGSRKRRSPSRRQECPFQLYGRRLPSARWALRVQDARHNHAVAADTEQLVAHPVARRLSLEQKRLVQALTERGVRPAVIVEQLKDRFPDKPVKVQDIYNARNFIRRERNAGREPFARPDGSSAASSDDQPDNGQITARRDEGDASMLRTDDRDASHRRQAPSEWMAMDDRLQIALQRVTSEFPRWESRRQRTFVAELERLLIEEQWRGGGSVHSGEEDPPLALDQPSQTDGDGSAPQSPMQTELLIAPPVSEQSALSPPSALDVPTSSVKSGVDQEGDGVERFPSRPETPSISL
jgi:hypothetical protein